MPFSRIMYIERKANETTGTARIGKVTFSKTRRTMFYGGKEYMKVKEGYKYNCVEVETSEEYWISGCRKDGIDRLYGEKVPVYIDEDVKEEYWTTIRNQPHFKNKNVSN